MDSGLGLGIAGKRSRFVRFRRSRRSDVEGRNRLKRLLVAAVAFVLASPLFGSDTSFSGLETLVYTSPAPVDDLAVASSRDTDLVIWTSFGHLYARRVTRNGSLVDSAPIEVASNVLYPSVASDGQSFLVLWSTPPDENSTVSIQMRFVGRRGEPPATQTVIPNASKRSRPRVTFAGSYFAFTWLAGGGSPRGRATILAFNRWGLAPQTLVTPFDLGEGRDDMQIFYWTYKPPTVLATDWGFVALSYDYTLRRPASCQIPEGCGYVWQYDAKYSVLQETADGLEPEIVSAPFLSKTSFALEPILVGWGNRAVLLWTTDDYLPERYGGDTIRAMTANGRDLPQPAGGDALFTSTTGAISALDAAAADDALWIAWKDQMPDYDPPQAPRIFIEIIARDGEKQVFPSVENAGIYDVSATNGRVAVAAYVPLIDALGGRLVLVTISEPSRTRAVRR